MHERRRSEEGGCVARPRAGLLHCIGVRGEGEIRPEAVFLFLRRRSEEGGCVARPRAGLLHCIGVRGEGEIRPEAVFLFGKGEVTNG